MELIHLIKYYSMSCSSGATFFATKFCLWITQCTTNMLGLSSYRSKQVNQLKLISTNQLNCEQVTFHFAFQPKLFHNVFNLHAPMNFCHTPPVGHRPHVENHWSKSKWSPNSLKNAAFSQQKCRTSFPLTQSKSGLVPKFWRVWQSRSNPNATKFAIVRIQSNPSTVQCSSLQWTTLNLK